MTKAKLSKTLENFIGSPDVDPATKLSRALYDFINETKGRPRSETRSTLLHMARECEAWASVFGADEDVGDDD